MRIVGVGGAAISAPRRRMPGELGKPDTPQTEGRALIAIEQAAPGEGTPRVTRYPAAGFLAQLIATRAQAPQTRLRRRAEPEEAIAVYRSMTKPVVSRRTFGTRA